MLPHQCLCLTQKCDYRRFVLAAQTTTTEQAQSLLIFSEDRNIFRSLPNAPELPILCFLRRSFCTPALKYKNAQIVRSLRHTQGPVIIFIKFLLHFSSLWVLSFVILTEKAVEYSDHVLVREIKGEDKGALELLT